LKNKVIKPCPDSRREGVDYFFFFKGSIYLSIYLSIILGFELGASHVNKKKKNSQKGLAAKHWWLTPVIPATQEVAISKTAVQSQPGEIVLETRS
jgi:hypothetical protein